MAILSHLGYLSISHLLFVACCLSSVALAREHKVRIGPVAGFIPDIWPSIVAIVLYSISGSIHWYSWYKWGKRYMLTLSIGMTCIVLGFIIRIVYSHNPNSLGIYILTTLFVLLSPCAFLATDYVVLHHISLALDPETAKDCLFIAPTKVVRIFITSDVVTFLLQSAGGGLSVEPSSATLGKNIALIGLILQLLSFALFTFLLLFFGWRIESRYPTQWLSTAEGKNMRTLFFAICFTCIGILIRSVFRIVEYSGGYRGPVAIHESYFYLLDALPLWIAMSAYCVIWPPQYIREPVPKVAYMDGQTPVREEPAHELARL